MALLIPCAFCGLRPVDEFLHGEVPEVPASITDAAARDIDRVHMRGNPTGEEREAWFHSAGCRRWTYLTRNRTTDDWS